MSLNWDLTAVKDREVNFPPTEDGHQNPVTYSLIMATMGVGIGRLTEANAGEFYARLRLWEKLNGTLLYGPDGPRAITPEDVRGHIGLTTNVSAESRAVWLKRIAGFACDDLKREYDRAEVSA